MKPGRPPSQHAIDLLEEATHLLRTAPAATLAAYYLGAIPFVLGLLFFWADMSRSPLAPAHLVGSAAGLAMLFLWMKFCQAVFMRRLRAQAAAETFAPPGWRRYARIFVRQAILQPSSLFILPLALLPVLPFAWVYGFYQNVSALDDGQETSPGALLKSAWRQAKLQPQSALILLALMFGFAGGVFLNWTLVCFSLPQCCKMLFGIESVFTRSPYALLNTTFFAAMAGLTYLCVDPILKTIFALRCFYGDSRQSGEDLKAELKPFVNLAAKTVAILFILCAAVPATSAGTAPTAPPAAAVHTESISPPELEQAINQTIHERKYLWRMPRGQVLEKAADEGLLARFFNAAGDLIRDWAHAVGKWLDKWLQTLFRHETQSATPATGYGWIMSLQVLLYGLAAVAIAALVVFLLRLWRQRQRPPAAVASEAIQALPDLNDENLRADQLPEDGWTRLAHELLGRGEFRLAMRAFYLAGLAHLAARNLIAITRYKSNRDYERELRRRAHALPNLSAVFGNNLAVFERCWYGTHTVSQELVQQFAAGVEQLKATG